MNNKRPILLLAETGFIIRNLLLGHFAEEISKYRKLIVAVQRPEDTSLQEIIRGKNIELIPFPREPYQDKRTNWNKLISWDNWIYGLRQAYKDNTSLTLQTRLFESSGNWKKRLVNRIPLFTGRIIKHFHFQNLIEDWYLNRYISQKSITKHWVSILKELSPEIVFSSMLTHSLRYRCSTDLPIVVAAHKLGIKTCTLVQSWDNLSSKTSVLPFWVDSYFTWSRSMSKELQFYNPRIVKEKIEITGSPQYDYHLDTGLIESRHIYLENKGLDSNKPYILIGTGTVKWMPDEMEKMVQLCTRIVLEIPGMQIIIRLHPKDNGERWKPYIEILSKQSVIVQNTSPEIHMDKGGFIPPIDFYKEQINVIYHSNLVINSSSSLTIDAAILDKPVICIAYDISLDSMFPEGRSLMYSKSEHYSKLTQTGGVWVTKSEDECVKAIKLYLKNPLLHKNERKLLVERVTDNVNLKSGIRLCNSLIKLL